MPATYESIASTTLSSATGTITFNSIPGTYTDLKLVVYIFGGNSEQVALRLNNDSGTNYSSTYVQAGGTPGSSRYTSRTYVFLDQVTSLSSTLPYLLICDVFNYANTSRNKTMLHTASMATTGGGYVEYGASLYSSTTAVTRLDLVQIGGTSFSIGTTATLYGIKAA